MKSWSIASTLMTVSLGASLPACGGVEIHDGSAPSEHEASPYEQLISEDFAQVDSALTACDDQQYDHWRYLSALAVAAGNELGRWNSAKDFVKQPGGIQLSAEGLARCKNGCENIKAILQLQSDGTKIIPRHDPGLLKQYLISFFDRQVNWNVSNVAPNHALTLESVSADVCGLRYHFNVTGDNNSVTASGTSPMIATHSNKCIDTVQNSVAEGALTEQDTCSGASLQAFTMELRGGNNYQLKNGQGKCLTVAGNNTNIEVRSCAGNNAQLFTATHKGNKNFEFKNVGSGKCLDIQFAGSGNGFALTQYNCFGAANQTFNMPNVTLVSLQPSTLAAQLKFAGDDSNKFLAFQSTATQVSIDPMGTMIDGGSQASSGACYEGATVYGANLGGKCCSVTALVHNVKKTTHGKLAQYAGNAKLFYCK